MSHKVVHRSLPVTVADLCIAIAEGRLRATREGEAYYAVRHADFLQFLNTWAAGSRDSETAIAG